MELINLPQGIAKITLKNISFLQTKNSYNMVQRYGEKFEGFSSNRFELWVWGAS
jgi:hypothetical protein